MKRVVYISFWASDSNNIDASFACYFYFFPYYKGFNVIKKNCKYVSVRNFYRL